MVFGSLASTYVGPAFSSGFVGKGFTSGWLFLAYAVQWLETIYGVARPAVGLKPKAIGWRQLTVSILFTVLFIATW